ncbi:ABC transporter ATP-binding protein [Roseibium sp. CAU 1637]|uniref:ABC transporter ATP-binding protein n=1 Tax=Roseibium limicola TaxID=2816037 RepID=A0A939ENJ1_9HYPH|nr:ABC transporter ATP-binding protein [Roseibium limicola]MBO0344254.1 ABC transporter ATP-binding protein [Roseibium limicola]
MALLNIEGLSVVYGGAIDAVSDVSLKVEEGALVALLGSNGAGKSTILKAISGILEFESGAITSGDVQFEGQSVVSIRAHQRARSGVMHVREGRHVFASMTVEDNLKAAGFAVGKRHPVPGKKDIERIYDFFPRLGERQGGLAGFLSGGEQQMLAIGRAMISRPKLMLVDEASLGLAPMIAEDIFTILAQINRETGLSILVVEQNVNLSLKHAEYAYILENGRIVLEGTPDGIGGREAISALYLGGSGHSAATAPHLVRGR